MTWLIFAGGGCFAMSRLRLAATPSGPSVECVLPRRPIFFNWLLLQRADQVHSSLLTVNLPSLVSPLIDLTALSID